MKRMKRLLFMVLTLVVVALCMPVTPVKAAKDNTKAFPTAIRSYPGSSSYTSFSLSGKKTIKSVKPSNSSMIVKVTDRNYYENNGTVDTNSYTIQTIADKAGKYILTVTLSDNSKKKITVYNYPSPIKFVKIDGKNYGYLERTKKKSCKIKVGLSSGYTIKSLQYTYNVKVKNESGYTTEERYKKFKNGGTIKINHQQSVYKYSSSSSDENYSYKSENSNDSLFAYTHVLITYKDKYTKKTETYSTYIASVLCK